MPVPQDDKHFPILNGLFDVREEIGHGAFGVVYRCLDLAISRSLAASRAAGRPGFDEAAAESQLACALKVVSKTSNDPDTVARTMKREVGILRLLSHPNIVGFRNYREDPKNHYLVMEYIPGGDLKSIIDQSPGKRLSNRTARLYFIQLAMALFHLHSLGVSHRDLKPQNILLTFAPVGDVLPAYPNRLVLVDFGLSRPAGNSPLLPALVESGVLPGGSLSASNTDDDDALLPLNPANLMQTICGTPIYFAPEIAFRMFGPLAGPGCGLSTGPSQLSTDMGYTQAVDIWSLGVLLFQSVAGDGRLPFPPDMKHLFRSICDGNINWPLSGDLALGNGTISGAGAAGGSRSSSPALLLGESQPSGRLSGAGPQLVAPRPTAAPLARSNSFGPSRPAGPSAFCPNSLHHLISHMLMVNPEQRASARDVLLHPWMVAEPAVLVELRDLFRFLEPRQPGRVLSAAASALGPPSSQDSAGPLSWALPDMMAPFAGSELFHHFGLPEPSSPAPPAMACAAMPAPLFTSSTGPSPAPVPVPASAPVDTSLDDSGTFPAPLATPKRPRPGSATPEAGPSSQPPASDFPPSLPPAPPSTKRVRPTGPPTKTMPADRPPRPVPSAPPVLPGVQHPATSTPISGPVAQPTRPNASAQPAQPAQPVAPPTPPPIQLAIRPLNEVSGRLIPTSARELDLAPVPASEVDLLQIPAEAQCESLLTIGRDPSCDISVSNAQISKRQCAIFVTRRPLEQGDAPTTGCNPDETYFVYLKNLGTFAILINADPTTARRDAIERIPTGKHRLVARLFRQPETGAWTVDAPRLGAASQQLTIVLTSSSAAAASADPQQRPVFIGFFLDVGLNAGS
ncbi:CAMK protein kinase, variant [Fonticula alba]|nr:CAMK protein kinase, variant [Fonticula alba]KCV72843.1 CAMK protein kinase, variant [Fonticula alba]|eukprot:XP_009492544.1 CAMK protein kinase, variant [Fonticula alba]